MPMSERQTHWGGAAGLRRRAEETVRVQAEQVPEDCEGRSPEETRRTLHELRVHQIELEMQNEELRRAQTELDAARARYFDLYDLAPVGYCTVSERGRILEANLTAAGLLGVARGELVQQQFTRFILPEDKDIYYLHRKRVFETGEPRAFELRMVKKDGTGFWVRLETAAAEDAGGQPVCRLVMSDITDSKRAETALLESVCKMELAVQEKTVLLQEIHHRVKNSLAVTASLLSMKADGCGPEARLALEESQQRIHSIALVHEYLCENECLDRINFGEYARNLAQSVHSTFGGEQKHIGLDLELDPIELGIGQAVPCALILNELLSNAFKYAFAGGRTGWVLVSFRQPEPGCCELAVEDDGVGLPDGRTAGLLRHPHRASISSRAVAPARWPPNAASGGRRLRSGPQGGR
jgi:PAS domain S-box-containing protein